MSMPERPDLEYVVSVLAAALPGLSVAEVALLDPVVLRATADPAALLTGRTITGVQRVGHFVVLSLSGADDLELAIHPMLAGRFRLQGWADKRPKDTALALRLSGPGDRALLYRDDRQMGKVFVQPRARRAAVPGLGVLGLDVRSPAFTREVFRAMAKKRRDQAKVFLMDKAALDSFGNAYADEALWAGGVHPKARVASLDGPTLDRLHDAMVQVLDDAAAEVARRAPPLDDKVRDFLAVRNRKGSPCPRCGAPIRVAGVNGHDAFFCAVCQPDTQGRGFVGWRPGAGLSRAPRD